MKEIFYGRICSMILDSMGRPYWIMECQKAKSESMDLRSGGGSLIGTILYGEAMI